MRLLWEGLRCSGASAASAAAIRAGGTVGTVPRPVDAVDAVSTLQPSERPTARADDGSVVAGVVRRTDAGVVAVAATEGEGGGVARSPREVFAGGTWPELRGAGDTGCTVMASEMTKKGTKVQMLPRRYVISPARHRSTIMDRPARLPTVQSPPASARRGASPYRSVLARSVVR